MCHTREVSLKIVTFKYMQESTCFLLKREIIYSKFTLEIKSALLLVVNGSDNTLPRKMAKL